LVGFDVLQQQVNLIRRFLSNAQTPDSAITRLSILLMTSKLLQASSRQMKICNPNDSVKEVLEFSEFNSLLHVYDNETDAIAAF
jgi:anti-anti-sigma regulatory factor